MQESRLVKNIVYTIVSNFASLLVSIAIALIVPKLVPVATYGYWQLFLLFASYVGFAHFGWLDGFYLKYGGISYDELDKDRAKTQMLYLVLTQSIIGAALLIYAFFGSLHSDAQTIMVGISLALVLTNTQTYFSYILQVSNRFQENAKLNVINLVFYGFTLILCTISGFASLGLMIFSYLLGRAASLVLAAYYCREVLQAHAFALTKMTPEVIDNIKIGINLLIANLSGSLIVGVISFGIERAFGITIFAKISLALALTNFVMVFMNAVGLVMFPLIRNTPQERITSLYLDLREVLFFFLAVLLFFYFPIVAILDSWLPKYADSLKYFAIIFPMVIFEGRRAFLTNPYMNALRLEKKTLKANVICFSVSLLLTIFFGFVFKNLIALIVSIVFGLALRSLLLERYLTMKLELELIGKFVLEVLVALIFSLLAWNLSLGLAAAVYFIGLLVLYFLRHDSVNKGFALIKSAQQSK
ncbi:MAG: hypothetical protein Q4E22_06760 [Coriobacteriia bacterium]|nr:hypothetical protein [Coriobacteriia bacterium]